MKKAEENYMDIIQKITQELEVKKWQVLDEPIQPNKEAHEKYNEYFALYKSIYHNLKDDMKKLTKIR